MYALIVRAAALSLLFIAPAVAQKPPATSPNGLWRCSAQGNIPIGLLTMSGNSYRFQVVSNTAWALNPSAGGNGSGQLTVAGSKLTPGSGPLKAKYGATTGFYGTTSSPYSGTYEYIDFLNDPKAAYLLRCYRSK